MYTRIISITLELKNDDDEKNGGCEDLGLLFINQTLNIVIGMGQQNICEIFLINEILNIILITFKYIFIFYKIHENTINYC